ncbi:MAG: TetR/AcrR family transcriptional regulator [Candidatus Enteromonas sp.]|nr:TetR/AcrR family transcriptional regulator [Candidatus Enteromonas sp.]
MPNQNDTKSKIIEAVEELIATKGVNNFSLRDIANYLDISTGNLYYHFKTKDEIISAIVEKHYAILERDYDIWLDKHKGELTINRFLEVLFYKGTELFNHSKIHIYLINECMANEILKKKTQELWEEWKNKLTVGVRQVYKNHDDVDSIAQLILVTIEGLIVKTVLGNKSIEDINKIKQLLERL